jgi:hypothetical protein
MSQVHSVTHLPVHSPLSEVCLPCWREAQDDPGGRCGQERGCYKTQFRRLSKGTIALGNTLRILGLCVPSPGLSGVLERLRQFDRAEHVCNALEVVCHRREADFNPCTGQSAHQQTWMSEDPVLDRCERMLDSGSP